MKPKKIRVNKKFANLNEAADYLNYYLNRNPEARISYADLLRLANNNGWTMEDQGLDNNSYRTVCTDDEGNELGIEMVPRFGVFAPNVEADPEDEPEEESEEEEESEDEPAEGEESEAEDEEDEEDDSQSYEEMFAWVQPGETFVWRDPEDDSEHSAEVVEVKSDDGKVHSTNTEIRAKVEGIDGVISIFCDEIVMLDEGEDELDEDSEEESEEDSEDDPEDDPSEVEDAEIVDDEKDDPEVEDKEEQKMKEEELDKAMDKCRDENS